MLLAVPIISFAQEEVTWEYPVKPGTNEWNNLTTYSEKINAYNIPVDIIKEISTAELVKTCLNYPELRLIFTRNDIQSGFDYVRSKFNGFSELEKRKDAGQELLKVYNGYNPGGFSKEASDLEIGRYIVQFTYIELLMAQTEILNKFNPSDVNDLLLITSKNYQLKKDLISYYGPIGLSTNVMLMGRHFNAELSGLKAEVGNKKVDDLINKGVITDSEIFDKIMSVCEKRLSNEK